ncbi:unnamed protein product [Cladocopium goreaui]|uniref:Tyr recombinase domain-containing protein n=1 Tax=Cladocopium goreaui TaxID=2562237 RepID=A0A9P1M3H6_9DINO|nr:unnamed protein product [Cladocopium goreaui]
MPFSFKQSEFADDPALKHLWALKTAKRKDRAQVGDFFGGRVSSTFDENSPVFPCFRSLLQGDHLGVEFALSAHAHLLETSGDLCESKRVQGYTPFPRGPDYQVLVIDDFVSISVCAEGAQPCDSGSCKDLEKAAKAYAQEEVLGSTEKDILGSRHFKAIGAEVNASRKLQSAGLTAVAAPMQKRIALVVLALRVMWLGGDKKGTYTRLDPPFRELGKAAGLDFDDAELAEVKVHNGRKSFGSSPSTLMPVPLKPAAPVDTRTQKASREADCCQVKGLESVIANDLLMTGEWKVEKETADSHLYSTPELQKAPMRKGAHQQKPLAHHCDVELHIKSFSIADKVDFRKAQLLHALPLSRIVMSGVSVRKFVGPGLSTSCGALDLLDFLPTCVFVAVVCPVVLLS